MGDGDAEGVVCVEGLRGREGGGVSEVLMLIFVF